ncbi:hypothetical protein [Natronospora cellulosivora (SeqCode)]
MNEKSSLNYKLLVILNILAFIAMVVVNYLANALPINDITTGEVSELYPNLFTPAGFTFAIWGLIYFLLAVFVAYQLVYLIKGRELNFVRRVSYLFLSSSLLNIVWIFAWHYLMIGLSLLIMILLLINLITLYYRIHAASREEPGLIISRIAFSIYVGWITIATVANVTVYLVSIGWQGFGLPDSFWMIILTIIATYIILRFMLKNKDWIYGLVGLWAFFGIVYRRLTTEPVEISVVIVLIIAMIAIAAGIIKIIRMRN